MTETLIVRTLRTTNDPNGNPRRLYLVEAPGRQGRYGTTGTVTVAAFKEGYTGNQFPNALGATHNGDVLVLDTVKVTSDEYERLLAKHGGILVEAEPKDAAEITLNRL